MEKGEPCKNENETNKYRNFTYTKEMQIENVAGGIAEIPDNKDQKRANMLQTHTDAKKAKSACCFIFFMLVHH